MNEIEQIKAEIKRLKKYSESAKKEWIDDGYNQNAFAEDCRIASFDNLLSFINSLPEEKPSEDERIRKELVEYFKHYSGGDDISVKFPTWIAYLEKQKEQQPASGNSEKPNNQGDLENAAEEYSKRVSDGHNYRDLTCGFIAGAQWQKEQMMKASIEGRIGSSVTGSEQYVFAYIGYGEYGNDGDKVKVIIVKEGEK